MDYTVNVTFSGTAAQQNRLAKFLNGATVAGDTADTLWQHFHVRVNSVSVGDLGVDVSFMSSDQGKAFCAWVCKECQVTAECAGYGNNGNFSYTYPVREAAGATEVQEAVRQIELESQKVQEAQPVNPAVAASASVADMALQAMLKSAKEEGIAEGRFQILKNIMESCDTLDEMLKLTGVTQNEFVSLFQKFNKKGK